MIVNATAPADVNTPARLQSPDQTTAMFGSSEGVNHRCGGVRRIVKAVDEFESERDQQGHAQQHKGPGARNRDVLHVVGDMEPYVSQSAQQRHQHDRAGNPARERMLLAIK